MVCSVIETDYSFCMFSLYGNVYGGAIAEDTTVLRQVAKGGNLPEKEKNKTLAKIAKIEKKTERKVEASNRPSGHVWKLGGASKARHRANAKDRLGARARGPRGGRTDILEEQLLTRQDVTTCTPCPFPLVTIYQSFSRPSLYRCMRCSRHRRSDR